MKPPMNASWLPWVRRRRARLRASPPTDSMRLIVGRSAPMVARLSEERRAALFGLVHVFLDEKTFEGCGGLEVTEEISVTIAVHACLLLVGLDVTAPYPGLDVIRVYPSTYRAPISRSAFFQSGAPEPASVSHRLGESSQRGFVVLAWDAVARGARSLDGHNVVLHEFAHQLDTADGVADGAPVLERSLYGPWAAVLGEAWSELKRDVAERRETVLDGYGATNPAEFFAVATEVFFETPAQLRAAEPALYDVLSRFYQQDPAAS